MVLPLKPSASPPDSGLAPQLALHHSMATSLRVAPAVPTSCGAHPFIGKRSCTGGYTRSS
jgi:hypothetical protein